MSWGMDDWQAASSSPDWGAKVAQALKRYFDDGKWLLEPAHLNQVDTEIDEDGVPVLLAIYEHPYIEDRRIGLRRRLDRPPFAEHGKDTPEASLAAEIAVYEISEPLGRYYDLLVQDDDAVWWWGDGFPKLDAT